MKKEIIIEEDINSIFSSVQRENEELAKLKSMVQDEKKSEAKKSKESTKKK
ncbi:MAG: hypothetical protein ACI9LN_002088 [Saprospiraceae bacterium]|jgi:hypothetical protein